MNWTEVAKEALPLFKNPNIRFTILTIVAMVLIALYLFHITTVNVIAQAQRDNAAIIVKALDKQTDSFERLRDAILKREIAKGIDENRHPIKPAF
jgi:hypothetical protein